LLISKTAAFLAFAYSAKEEEPVAADVKLAVT